MNKKLLLSTLATSLLMASATSFADEPHNNSIMHTTVTTSIPGKVFSVIYEGGEDQDSINEGNSVLAKDSPVEFDFHLDKLTTEKWYDTLNVAVIDGDVSNDDLSSLKIICGASNTPARRTWYSDNNITTDNALMNISTISTSSKYQCSFSYDNGNWNIRIDEAQPSATQYTDITLINDSSKAITVEKPVKIMMQFKSHDNAITLAPHQQKVLHVAPLPYIQTLYQSDYDSLYFFTHALEDNSAISANLFFHSQQADGSSYLFGSTGLLLSSVNKQVSLEEGWDSEGDISYVTHSQAGKASIRFYEGSTENQVAKYKRTRAHKLNLKTPQRRFAHLLQRAHQLRK